MSWKEDSWTVTMSPPSGLLTRERQSAQTSASLRTVGGSPDFRTGTRGTQTLFNRDPPSQILRNHWENKRKSLHSHRNEEQDFVGVPLLPRVFLEIFYGSQLKGCSS